MASIPAREQTVMKRRSAVAVALTLLAGSISAQTTKEGFSGRADLSVLNCKSVFDTSRTNTVIVLAWLQAHYLSKDARPIIDLDKMASDALKMTTYCDANPSKAVMEAADAIYGARL
jgi:acid stress chaperone HdeB